MTTPGGGGRKRGPADAGRTHVLLLCVILIVSSVMVFRDEASVPLLYQTLRGQTPYSSIDDLYIPPSLDPDRQRSLSLNLGGGKCKWQPPSYEVPNDVDFHKTIVVGYPSGDKRMVYLQMEALAGWPSKDEWDFAYSGMTNHPFIKGNYPHHEGIWGWGDAADQVVLIVPNIRRSMVEYHDILWDLGYATTWEEASQQSDNLYGQQPTLEEYYEWRDSRVLDEVRWYGWFIDYWMEAGLRRDIFSHQLTTEEHWNDLLLKPFYTRSQLSYENYVSNGTVVSPSYDPHCAPASGDISGGCAPVAVISADRLRRPGSVGQDETSAIATVLTNDARTGQHVIAPEAWGCIWKELIQAKKGPKTIYDRPGYSSISIDYNFSAAMLQEMLDELDRLIAKYSGPEWTAKETANRLAEILTEHRAEIEVELDEVNRGERRLSDRDFLGPRERAKKRGLVRGDDNSNEVASSIEAKKNEDRPRYFIALEQKRFENKRRDLVNVGQSTKRGGDGRKTMTPTANGADTMSDGQFVAALSSAVERIRSLEASGGMDRETALSLVERVREVAMEARVVLLGDAQRGR